MKKFIITSLIALTTSAGFASDYTTEETTTKTTEVYVAESRRYSTYCTYTNDENYCSKPKLVSTTKMAPITVHTGRTVTVQDHYDVYQPRIVYDKVKSYTTTKTCAECYK